MILAQRILHYVFNGLIIVWNRQKTLDVDKIKKVLWSSKSNLQAGLKYFLIGIFKYYDMYSNYQKKFVNEILHSRNVV